MKLITLNIWGGHLCDDLLTFFQRHQDTDVFCLQEVYHNADQMITKEERYVCLDIFAQISSVLPNHTGYFAPAVNGIYGLATFVNNTVKVLEQQTIEIYHNPDYPGVGPKHNRILQAMQCLHAGHVYQLINVHGLWNGEGKSDSPKRIEQANIIKHFANGSVIPTILCGDFNLRPDTKSIAIIAEGMHNLIDLYHITSTRTSYYPKDERYADYIFTSPDIVINDMQRLDDEVSDHAALYVDCDVYS